MRKDVRWTAILGKIVVILVLIPHPLSLGKTFYMIPFDTDCDTSSPPAILKAGTAGSSVVYANGTSAGSTVTSLVSSFNPNGYNVVTGTYDSGSTPSSVSAEDSDRFTVNSTGTATSSLNYNPTGYNLLGSTSHVSGSVENLTGDDGVYMVFGSYLSRDTESEESVDSDSSNVDSSQNRGSSSNFTAQQTGPDSEFDTLTEEYFGGMIEDYVDSDTSDVDSSSDKGSLTDFDNMKDISLGSAVLTEAPAAGVILLAGSDESQSAAGASSHNFNYNLQNAAGNNRLVVVSIGWEDAEDTASVTSITFDSVDMEEVATVVSGTGYSAFAGLYYLNDTKLPATSGSKNIAVTTSEVITREIYIAVVEYTGVAQETPDDFDTHVNTAAGSTSVTLTVDDDDSIIVACAAQGGTNAWSNTNNLVNLQDAILTSSGAALGHHANASSGDTTVGWNNLGTRECMVAACWSVTLGSSEYGLDQEIQWTSITKFLQGAELVVYAGTFSGAEELKVECWNQGSSQWVTLGNLTSNSWNNYTVGTYLTSSTFTVRFKGTYETGDPTQDSWQIDASLIRLLGSGSIEDTVDNDTSDVDSSADIGSHSNFANQQSGPDSTFDMIQEENTRASGGNWGITSSSFSSTYSPTDYRYMGGMSPDKDYMKVTKLHIRVTGSGIVAVSLYTGGTLADPTGAVKRTESYDVSISVGWNEIDVPDYYWEKNTETWIGWTLNTGVYYSTSSSDCGDFQSGEGRWAQTSPSDADETQPMPDNPGSGSFGNYWYAMYVEYEIEPEYQLDLEVQWTGLPSNLPNEELCIYTGSTDAEDVIVDIWDTGASEWDTLLSDLSPSTWSNVSISSWLTSDTVTIRFKGSNETGDVVQDQWSIDVALIHVWSSDTARYRLDLEAQWTGVSYDDANEYLCIYGGSQGSEDISVDVWYSSSWQNVLSDLSPGWNNVSVGSYLTGSTFTIRFKGGTDGSDTVKDTWQVDFSMLHLWTKQYTAEVELQGSGNLLEWTQLNWTVDSRWTSDSISVTLQLYDYDNQSYPGSGDGCISYTSGPADTDETKFEVIASNPEHFRNGTGWWKARVKGVLNLDTQFNMSLDLVDVETTYYSEHTASTEFVFDDVTDNQSPFLNFTAVNHNSRDGASVTIQVWNYTTSSYPVGGEGFLSYTSDGADLTRHLNITTNPSSCLSGFEAKVRITAVNATTESFQQLINHVKLLQGENRMSHDYILDVQSQEASLWQVRLRAYSQTNIQVLDNCTVSFKNETSQIVVLDGAFDQSTGGWTNLVGLDSLHIVVDVSSLRVGAAKIGMYLDVRVPGTSSYASYVIHLKITQ